MVLLLPGIRSDLWNRDEVQYAEVAREVVSSRNPWDLKLFGKPYAEKPPLGEWLTAASFRLLGESNESARLPHALAAALACSLLVALGRSIGTPGKAAAAGVLLATALLFVASARMLLTDSVLLLLDLIAVMALERFRSLGASMWLVIAGLSIGLALLTKGPIACAPPVFFAGGVMFASRQDRGRLFPGLAAALALATATALPWSLHAARSGTLSSFLVRENLLRLTHTMEGHRGSPLAPWIVLFCGVFPWTAVIARVFRPVGASPSPAVAGLRAWALGILLLFSFSRTFLPHYDLLALPPAALLAALAHRPPSPRQWRLMAWITAGTASAIFVGAVLGLRRAVFPDLLVPAVLVLALPAGLTLALPLLPVRFASARRLLSGCVLCALILAIGLPARLAPARGLAKIGKATAARRLPGEPVGGFELREPALPYYARAIAIERWSAPSEILGSVRASGARSALAWLTTAESVELARSRMVRLRVLASAVNTIESTPQGGILLCRVQELYKP